MRTLPRLAPLAIALAIALTACGDSGDAGAGSPSPVKDGSPSPATESPSPSSDAATPTPPVSVAAGPARCTLVLGMSVTANWFLDGGFESLPGIEDARWELIWESGYDVVLYADPGGLPYSATPLSPCAGEPDRAVFQVAARDWQTPDTVVAELRSTIANIRATWPTVGVIELIPIVGGPDSAFCSDPDVPDKGVLATLMNPPVVGAIAEVADGADVVAGPDLLVQDCAQFRDGAGHLTIDGSTYIASVLGRHYGS